LKAEEVRMQTLPVGADMPRPRGERLRAAWRVARESYLQMFGIPDYERYLAHMAERHPGQPVLNQREFCARAIDRL
jgi:uncharacterized short protein YbdD (DUF466 family)